MIERDSLGLVSLSLPFFFLNFCFQIHQSCISSKQYSRVSYPSYFLLYMSPSVSAVSNFPHQSALSSERAVYQKLFKNVWQYIFVDSSLERQEIYILRVQSLVTIFSFFPLSANIHPYILYTSKLQKNTSSIVFLVDND